VLPEPVADLVEAVRPSWRAVGIDVAGPTTGVVVRGRRRGETVNVLLLDARGRPGVFVKAALRAGADDLLAELDALERLAALRPAPSGVPRALGYATVAGRVVTAQTVVGGVSLAHRLRDHVVPSRRDVTRGVRAALGWLAAFQERTRAATVDVDLARPLATLADDPRAERLSPAGRAVLDRHLTTAARHRVVTLPATWAHGDLWPGNVVLRRGVAGVVDWGHLRERASPLLDVSFLLHTTAHWAPWRDEPWTTAERAVDRAFAGDGWYARLARAAVASRLHAWGVPVEVAPALVLATLLDDTALPGRDVVGPAVPRLELAFRFLDADDREWRA
jgi:hypothetical protein